MSRPGFPIDMVLPRTCNNTYVNWQGQSFPGTDRLDFWRVRYEDKAGANTPGWPNAIRTNAYLRSVFTWNQEPLNVNGTNNVGGGHVDQFFGEWGNTFLPSQSPWSWDNNPLNLSDEVGIVTDKLISKIIDKIQSNRVNTGEIFETRAQTASMVTSVANRIAGTFQALHKGNFAGAARYLTGAEPRTRGRIRSSGSGAVTSGAGGISEQWLALQYGWKPLLQDVYNSCEVVRKAWSDDGGVTVVTANAHVTGSKITFDVDRLQPHGPTFIYETGSREVRGNASVAFAVNSSLGSSLSQLGITNPASLAWELLPYSFVADWFFPVGSFLERLDYSRGLSFRYGSISIKATQDVRRRIKDSHGTNGGVTANWSGGSGSGSAMVMTRESLDTFPPPPPPRFKDPFSLTHVANALSLLDTAVRGISHKR